MMGMRPAKGFGVLLLLMAGVFAVQVDAAEETVFFSDRAFAYQQPVANNRSMRTGMRTFWNGEDQHIFELQLGDAWGLVRTPSWGLEGRAGVLARFDANTPSFYLENADLMGALAVEWRIGPGALECQFYHISSHLGGDVAQNGLRHQVNVSREQAALTYMWAPTQTWRVYAGPDILVHADPQWMQGRVNAVFGVEWRPARWVAAVHALGHGDYVKDMLDITLLTGYDLSPADARIRQVLHLYAFRGHKRAGQLEAEVETALGVGIYLSE